MKMIVLILIKCLLLLFLHLTIVGSQLNRKNYGPYALDWTVYETCKGPKPADCGQYDIADRSNMSDVVFAIDLDKNCPVTAARVTISSLQPNNKTKKLFNYALDKPCEHFVLGPILVSSFQLNNKCKINKGHYNIHLDMVEKANMFLGPSFFYGTFEFKIVAHNKANNFFCIRTILEIVKSTGG